METNENKAPSEVPTPESATPEAPTPSATPTKSPEPTPQLEPTPAKSSNPLTWCLGILAIIGIVAAAVFAYLYFTTPTTTPTPNNGQSSTTPDTPTTTEETEITDTLLKKDLDEKIAIIHDTTETGPFFTKRGLGLGYYNVRPLYSGEGLSEVAKLVHVAKSIAHDYTISGDAMQSIITERGFDEENAKIFMQTYHTGIKGETLATKYHDVFGETLNKGAINDQTYCPVVFYNSAYDFYYLTYECGGTGPDDGLYYKNKYTIDDKHAYVYVSTGTFNSDDHKIYCEPIVTTMGETNDSPVCEESVNPQGYDIGDYVIDETNYQKYAQYRFIFNKADDGTYYFSKVEKL